MLSTFEVAMSNSADAHCVPLARRRVASKGARAGQRGGGMNSQYRK